MVNVSEGRDERLLGDLAGACGASLLDLHADPSHHRSVLTLGGPASEVERAVRVLAREVLARLDLGSHQGVHPRIGVLDVVPFVGLPAPGQPGRELLAEAVGARDRFAGWAGEELELPCFLYGPPSPARPDGPWRTLPEVRRAAFGSLAPDAGPPVPHPTAGGCAVGARGLLVAYNLWLEGADLATARRVARSLRDAEIRALGLEVGDQTQVSCNLVDPFRVGPEVALERVRALLGRGPGRIARAELVGLIPAGVLRAIPEARWAELDLSPERTIEAHLAGRGGR